MEPLETAQGELLPTRASLLRRLQGHDDSAGWQQGWREFFEFYHAILYRYACRQGLSECDAKDVVQEVVIGVAKGLPSFRYDPQKCRFKTWLFRIAHNRALDHLRRRAYRERGLLPAEAADAFLEDMPDSGTLAPDAAWDANFEASIRRTALELVSRRIQPMTMRLYLYHVVDGNDVRTTVDHFRESKIRASDVYVAKHRVQRAVDRELERLRGGGIPG